MAIPADILQAFAASNHSGIPDGITPGYLAENRDHAPLAAIFFLFAIATILLILRSAARLLLVKQFGLDDWLAVLTVIPYVAFVILSTILIDLGSGRHIEYITYVLDVNTVNLTESLDFWAHLIYTTALVVCRLSGLAFYRRVCNQNGKLIPIINIAAAFIMVSYIPQLLLILLHCLPVTTLWPYGWQPEVNNFKCLPWGIVYLTNSAISLTNDMILFTIPAFIIYGLQTNMKRKVALSLVLFPGVLVVAISCVRLYLVVKGQFDVDQSWVYSPMLAIENAEIGLTLIALCVPGLKPLFLHYFSVIRETMAGKTGASTSPDSTGMKGSNANRRSSRMMSSKHTFERTPSDKSETHLHDPYGENLIVTECKAEKGNL